MAFSRSHKQTVLDTLHRDLTDVGSAAGTVVVAHYKGLTVAEVTNLRRKVRAAGAQFQVTKNTLTRRALQGTEFVGVEDLFTGPTAVAYSKDPVAAAKVVVEFAKDNEKLVVLGGSLGNQRLDKKGVEALASMPSLDELRAKIIGLLNAPATKLARVVQAPAGQVARVIQAKSQQS